MIIDNVSPNYRIDTEFLSSDQLLAVKEQIKLKTEAEWSFEFETNYPKQEDVSVATWESMQIWNGMAIVISKDDPIYNSIYTKAKSHVEERFNTSVKLEQFLLNRWRPGREQTPHIDYFLDDEDNDQEVIDRYSNPDPEFFEDFKNNFKTKNFSTMIYLNSDFVGGELYFPQYDNLQIPATENHSICFKGDTNHLHGVKMIEEGIRYTISIFWTEE